MIVDRNRLQQGDWTEQTMHLEPLADKWRAFGWSVIEVDGHSILQLLQTFARLPFGDKAKVLQLLEGVDLPDVALPEPLTRVSGNVTYLFAILPALVAFTAAGESAVFDPGTKALTSRPLGWQLSNHRPNGPTDGWDELKGYWQGRRKANA